MFETLSIHLLLLRSFRLYREHLSTYLGYSAWLLIPVAGIGLVQLFDNIVFVTAGFFVFSVADLILSFWLAILLIRLSADLLQKKSLDLLSLQKGSFQLMAPFLLVMGLQALTTFGGLLLFIIPGLIFLVWYGFAHFSVVLDQKKGLEALSFSRALVSGRFFHTAFLFLGGPLVIMLVYSLFFVLLFFSISFAIGNIEPLTLIDSGGFWLESLESILEVFFFPLLIIYETTLYFELKKPRKHNGLDETCTIA